MTAIVQLPESMSFDDLATDAATVAGLAARHRSALLGLQESLRKTEGELSNQGVRGIADLLQELDMNLELLVEEAKALAGSLEVAE